jgi:hypothetical protein
MDFSIKHQININQVKVVQFAEMKRDPKVIQLRLQILSRKPIKFIKINMITIKRYLID